MFWNHWDLGFRSYIVSSRGLTQVAGGGEHARSASSKEPDSQACWTGQETAARV